jgi:hypothetical protein
LPSGYDEHPERRYPSIYVIQGYTGAVPMWHIRSPFRPTFPRPQTHCSPAATRLRVSWSSSTRGPRTG